MTTGIAAIHAYVTDTTDSSSRSRVFSLSTGLLFTGVALGPTIGSLLVKYTKNILSVFYFATIIHILYGLMIWFVIPESLSRAKKAKAQQMYKDNLNTLAHGPAKTWVKSLFSFLQPLAVILPTKVKDRQSREKGRNWNLTCVAIAYSCVVCVVVSITALISQAVSLTKGIGVISLQYPIYFTHVWLDISRRKLP
jgi:MFS family permease